MKGIDISNCNGNVDFARIKEQAIEICLCKATEGLTFDDGYLKENYNGCKANNIKFSAYHFLRANDPIEEAQHFVGSVEGLNLDCKVAIDVEVTMGQTAEQISNNILQFSNYLKNKGIDFCIYTYSDFYNNYLNDEVKKLPIWIANYSSNNPNVANEVGWQYSGTGNIDGVNGYCDLDEFNDGILTNNSSQTPILQPMVSNHDLDIQQKLRKLHIKDDYECEIVCDNNIGTRSRQAIRRFESICGLSIDNGVWGNECETAYQDIIEKPLLGIPYKHIIPTRYIEYRLGTTIDGVFFNQCSNAVKDYERQHGLTVDSPFGLVGQEVWNSLIGQNY